MYQINERTGGATLTCGACGMQTPVHTATTLRVGDAPDWGKVQTGKWDWDANAPAMRLLKFSRTDAVDACPDCTDRLRRQKRDGGPNHLPRRVTPPRLRETYLTRMPTLVKHSGGTP